MQLTRSAESNPVRSGRNSAYHVHLPLPPQLFLTHLPSLPMTPIQFPSIHLFQRAVTCHAWSSQSDAEVKTTQSVCTSWWHYSEYVLYVCMCVCMYVLRWCVSAYTARHVTEIENDIHAWRNLLTPTWQEWTVQAAVWVHARQLSVAGEARVGRDEAPVCSDVCSPERMVTARQ